MRRRARTLMSLPDFFNNEGAMIPREKSLHGRSREKKG